MSQNRPDPRPDPRNEVVRQRKRQNASADPLGFDLGKVPEGLTYEFKRTSIVGQEDTTHQLMLAEQGWLPVDASAHPEMMPPGYKGAIRRGDLVLMERPVELTREAQVEDERRARDQVRMNEEQLAHTSPNSFERTNEPGVRPRVTRSVEPHRQVPD